MLQIKQKIKADINKKAIGIKKLARLFQNLSNKDFIKHVQ